MAHTLVHLLVNFMVVFVGIILFMAPFYLVFLYRQRGHKMPPFNHSLEQFFSSQYANYLVFFWALGEATVWFVLPEFLIVLMIFMRVHRRVELLIYDIYGTIAGTLLAFSIYLNHSQIAHLPFIKPKMVHQVTVWYNHYGFFGLIFQPFSGVPYKVFTFTANDYHFFVPLFLLFAVLVRISRYYIMYAILQALYPVLHKYVYRNYVPLFVGAVFVFSLLLLRISSIYG
jgi:membrane protein YqaA with SNARE-associated domain